MMLLFSETRNCKGNVNKNLFCCLFLFPRDTKRLKAVLKNEPVVPLLSGKIVDNF